MNEPGLRLTPSQHLIPVSFAMGCFGTSSPFGTGPLLLIPLTHNCCNLTFCSAITAESNVSACLGCYDASHQTLFPPLSLPLYLGMVTPLEYQFAAPAVLLHHHHRFSRRCDRTASIATTLTIVGPLVNHCIFVLAAVPDTSCQSPHFSPGSCTDGLFQCLDDDCGPGFAGLHAVHSFFRAY